ncbi:glycosyltransferase family 4 protein [Thermopolyspora sp. NPDC052614]|uniref:glycosyltransferase family 4 protein n=1 Tax=Thermopolyspora sp. NPDC052614 TaxID=3155682 RepID=UPI0034244BBC
MVCGPGGPELDGVGDYVERLVQALGGVGVEATTVPMRPGGGPPASRWLSATLRAALDVRRMRPDLVHVHFAPSAFRFSAMPGLLPLLLPSPVPLVVTLHEYGWWSAPSWIPDALWRRLERAGTWDRETGRLVPSGSAVIVTNPEHARQVETRMRRHAYEVPLAPNVTDHGRSPKQRRILRERLGVAPDDLLLAFFGFVHPVKGVRYLLEALAKLRVTRPGTRLLVIGGFTSQALPEPQARAFRAELDDLAIRYGVADAVTFTGYLPAPAASRMLHAADLAVLPYTAGVTAKSGALLTTLAHGLPTAITTPDAPDHRTIPDGPDRSGCTDRPDGPDRPDRPDCVATIPARRDAEAIARTVERLAADPALRHRMAAAGRALAARHSWSRVAAAHRALYDRLIGRTPGRTGRSA